VKASLLSLPAPLRPGDRVGLVAASSALEGPEPLLAGLEILRSWGLEPQGDPLALLERRWGYLAGRDADRLADLQPRAGAAGTEPALLACVRGGWGAARLLEARPQARANWLLGFSDVTALLFDRVAQGWTGGVHGPLLTTLAAEPDWSRERLRALLFGEPLPDLQGETWCGGSAEGPLLVANLTVASHLLGTRHLPPLAGAILVLEDVGEAPYRIDRMLTHWRLCGALQQLAGLGFGAFRQCEAEPGPDPARRFSLEQVLRERSGDLGIPVLAGLPVGHQAGNAALPLGVRARLDGDHGRLQLLA
jgi:muramoyltetrapeptide carboxypeptidase